MWFFRRKARPSKNPAPPADPGPEDGFTAIRIPKLPQVVDAEGTTNIYNTPNMLRFPKRRRSSHHRSRR
jgi:hypothetical protein